MRDVVRVRSFSCVGFEDREVGIEVLKSRGLQQLSLTGLPGPWLRDSRDKLRSLAARRGTWGSLDRLLVHLLPCDESKAGAHLETPIVLACRLALEEEVPEATLARVRDYAFIGSLGLDGSLRPTEESKLLEDLYPGQVLGPSRFATIEALWDYLVDPDVDRCPPERAHDSFVAPIAERSVRVEGRALERFLLGAASLQRLPVLLMGPPGVGKSHLALWARSLVAPPDAALQSAIRRIWSLAGSEVPRRPFVAPHSRVHVAELVGRSRAGRAHPGFFSLAHGGLLVLDEFSELNRDSREILRTVLDSREIRRNGLQGPVRWPADFWFIATSNPCACGYFGSNRTNCRCTTVARQTYSSRLSGPLLDRFALKLFLTEGEATRGKRRRPSADEASEDEWPRLPEDEGQLEARLERARRALTPALESTARERVLRHAPNASRREIENEIRLFSAFLALDLEPERGEMLLQVLRAQNRSHLFAENPHASTSVRPDALRSL